LHKHIRFGGLNRQREEEHHRPSPEHTIKSKEVGGLEVDVEVESVEEEQCSTWGLVTRRSLKVGVATGRWRAPPGNLWQRWAGQTGRAPKHDAQLVPYAVPVPKNGALLVLTRRSRAGRQGAIRERRRRGRNERGEVGGGGAAKRRRRNDVEVQQPPPARKMRNRG
jgi:hypothetical protein